MNMIGKDDKSLWAIGGCMLLGLRAGLFFFPEWTLLFI
jgi:hypothetical protein